MELDDLVDQLANGPIIELRDPAGRTAAFLVRPDTFLTMQRIAATLVRTPGIGRMPASVGQDIRKPTRKQRKVRARATSA